METKQNEVEIKEAYMQIQLDPELKKRVKVVCAGKGITVKVLITRLLTDYLESITLSKQVGRPTRKLTS